MSQPALAPNSITSFWRTQPHRLDSHRSTQSLPEQCDIVVIGAGYAGASVAHHILEQTDPSNRPSIVILEGREACSGATGRNGGHLKPDPYNRVATLAKEHGIDVATEVAEFEARHVDAIRDVVEKEKIDCDLSVTEAADVQLSDLHARRLKEKYDCLVASGCQPTKRTRYIGAGGAEAFSGVKSAVACFTGTIRAKKVIVATNGYTSSVLPQYKNRIIPVRGTCSRIVAPSNNPAPRLTRSYTIRHNSWNYDYLIPRRDGSIVVGGARPAFIDNPESWYNVSDDGHVLESAVRYFDNYMQRHFVGWEKSHAYTDRVWTGIMGYSSDGLPHWIIGGFTGHGMPQIFLSAEGVAKMVVQGMNFKDTGLPRLFQTTQARLDSTENTITEAIFKREAPAARL
ncbi:hypothetical protein BDV12DRAFT_194015 [Aspergillus spectabilis]